MLKETNTTSYFNVQKEESQNPFIGFCSFQHFRGEKLYSDIIVRPENKMCETEDVECYPVPEWVAENGREEGYYPDTTIAYIRVLWKEFEPKRRQYNFKFIEDILNAAKQHGQTVAFRLLPHSTREIDDVPEWLKEIIPCPLRPAGMRVKDSPTAPEFLQFFGEAIRAFGERFDGDPTLDTVDICLPGAWGEGHKLELYPDEDIKKLFDIHTEVFKETRLIAQLARPDLAKRASVSCPIGLRGDGMGEPWHLYNRYGNEFAQFSDAWKTGPISFEAYWWLGEWKRKGWDIDEIIQTTLNWHISSFNAKSIPVPYEWKEKVDYWVSKMGYHFALDYFKYPSTVSSGDEAVIKIGVDNTGVAPIYRKIPLHLRLINKDNSYEFDTNIDITKWLPGKTAEKFSVVLPNDIKKGDYDIEIGLFNDYIPVIYLCTDACRNGSYYKVGNLKII